MQTKTTSLTPQLKISLQVAQNGTDFVGIKITQAERIIVFPMGYNLQPTQQKQISKSDRKQILNLINAINKCTVNKKGEKVSIINGKNDANFPLKSIFYIIEDFLEHQTYYTEKEILYSKQNSGKIHFPKTIKHIKPTVSSKGIAFLDFIVRKNRIQENSLITELHKYCVYKCFSLFGFLYTSILPEIGILTETDISKNKKYYTQFLQEKIDSTFKEENIELFQNMKNIINNFSLESENITATFGTTCFQVVWESLIDSMFSTVNQSIKEKYFYPTSIWHFADGSTSRKNAPLRPDTIMIQNGKCFIIDSKYYSYSMLKEISFSEDNSDSFLIHGSIPGTDSIQKQITYAQYLDADIAQPNAVSRKNYRFNHKDIFNIFILPANNTTEKLRYIASASAFWHDNTKNYHTIHAFTLDTKFVLENKGKKSKELIETLINILEKIK